ncbi:copper amine oxidase-like protein [Heliophilum fasciatum]|uniref:Copper amine oxidase-like protein n=1 Tax=Heliophilum fasciatum TaxID=35700 RepID=A0A4V2SX84_9FIRM|nr:copper amine oxidase-like protein [Heliophilum fasciatum]
MISKNKIAAVVLSSAMALTSALPAFASSTYEVNKVSQIEASGSISGLRVIVTVPANTLKANTPEKIRFTLPTDLTMPTGTNFATIGGTFSTPMIGANLKNQFTNVSAVALGGTGTSGNNYVEFTVYKANDPASPAALGEGRLVIDFPALKASGLNTGDVKLKAEAASDSAFSNASITIATVGSGSVAVSVDDIKNISSSNSQPVDSIYFKEDRSAALKTDPTSIKLKLPAGFSWANKAAVSVNSIWGTSGIATVDTTAGDERELIIKGNSLSSQAAYFRLDGATINVDESVAKKGDVIVNVSGATTTTPSSFTIARYGEFNTNVSVYGDVPTIPAGKNFDTISEIGSFKIEEEIAGSLIDDRTITLTLPEGARWNTPNSASPYAGFTKNGETKEGRVNGISWTIVDKDDAGRILKGTFDILQNNSTTAAKYILEKAQVSTAVDFSGDLAVEVGGTAGMTGKLVLAKVAPSATVSVSEVKPVTLGLGAQAIGDITITEGIKEAFNKDNTLLSTTVEGSTTEDNVINVQLPLGVFFDGTPTVEVTSGDMLIETSSITVNQNGSDGSQGSLRFRVKSSSTTPSAIKISNVKITSDRTVPEGDIVVKVRGSAVNKSAFSGRGTAASAVVAKLVTPAPSEVKPDATFKIGDTKYNVNGVEKSMDVAPYIKDGRTFLPVRFVAEALGVTSDNIIFDGATGTVTLIKGSTVAQFTIGSKELKINGATIQMDVAAEISSDRTMLPLRYIAQALGASVAFDEATQTVTVK